MYLYAEERFEEVQKIDETDGLAFKMENNFRVTKIFVRITVAVIKERLCQIINS